MLNNSRLNPLGHCLLNLLSLIKRPSLHYKVTTKIFELGHKLMDLIDEYLENQTDKDLILLLQKGSKRDLRPFAILVERHESRIYDFCLRYLRSPELAEEVCQDCFLKIFRNFHNLEKPEKFKSWAIKIASSLCTDLYRRNRKKREVYDSLQYNLKESYDFESQDSQSLKIEQLKACIEKLSHTEKEILILYYFSELSVSEISESLALSESAAKMRLKRAREKLTNMMAKSDDC